MTNDMQVWLRNTSEVLRKHWGLSNSFADRAALLLAYFYQYGLSPRITSGYRSKEHQAMLAQRYEAGDRSVIVKPATVSKHSTETWLGNPASEAIDVSTNNPSLAARIASALKIGAGFFFKTPDPVHFFQE